MSTLTVLVTGVGGGGVGEQIIKCLRLSSLNYRIIGCDMNPNSKGLKAVDKAYIMPPASSERYADSILKICRDCDVKVAFYGSEPELKVFSEKRELFEAQNVYIPLNSRELIATCMDKMQTMDFLRHEGFKVQKYWEIQSEEDLEKIDIFPVVMKPSVGGGGSVNTFIAQNEYEATTFGKYLLKIYSKFLAQEYVGDPDHEYTVGVLCNRFGDYVNSIAVRKSILSGLSNKVKIPNRTGRKELGDTLAISSGISQGEIGRFAEVTEPSKRISRALKTTASINVQCRIHNGEMYVFEINPRISGTSSLRAMVGFNEPDYFIRERILGETFPVDFEYQSGYIVRGLDETYISFSEMEQYTKL